YHQPVDLVEALKIATQCGADFDFVAGGTDLLPNYKQRLNPRANLISLARVRELAGIGESDEGGARGGAGDGSRAGTRGSGAPDGTRTRIGAAVTLTDLAQSRLVRERFPVLASAASEVASPLIQNSATLG